MATFIICTYKANVLLGACGLALFFVGFFRVVDLLFNKHQLFF